MKKDFLLKLEKADPETTRFLLLEKNYFFNKLVNNIRQEDNQIMKKLKIEKLAESLDLRMFVLETYINMKKFFLKEIARQNIYYVYDNVDGFKNVIDEDGIYIKIELGRGDKYYESLIKQVRADLEWMAAPESEQEAYLSKKGNFTCYFLNGKKAPKHRNQHGYNKKEDMEIYLKCEEMIQKDFNRQLPPNYKKNNVTKKDNEKLIRHAIDRTAEVLGCYKNKKRLARIYRIYYEVCDRYKLPTYEYYLSLEKYLSHLQVQF